ncbi:MAG: asparagine synthetase B, partial [Alphaproteobacteria bacterium]|nr:asparagine synthetase B [Alphaproteobacteria bacterium]
MCGIAGILDRDGQLSPAELEQAATRMGEMVRHRGPDGEGVWCDAPAGIALAHRRLAVIAPTPEGRQPAVSRDSRHVLSYNGEIYNFRDIARELAAAGHAVDTASDTVVLAEAIAAWGLRETVGKIVGMFAFAVYDRHERTLTLVRDRLG